MLRAIGLLISVIFTGALCAQPRDVASLPLSQCTFEQVIGILTFESIDRASIVAAQSLPLLRQLEAVNTKAKKPSIPVGEQLGPKDLDLFSRLSQQIAASTLAQLIESHRGRDLRVLSQFIRLADQEYRWQKVPKDGEDDFMPAMILAVLREQLPDVEVTEPSQGPCTMDYALHRIVEPALGALGEIRGIPEGVAFVANMMKKYNNDLDMSKMAKPDADALIKWRRVLGPAWRHRTFIHDVERIKIMARAADLNAKAKAQDLTFAGGDIAKIGATVDHMIKHGQIDADTQVALKVWFLVNEKIPADMVKFFTHIPNVSRGGNK